MTEDRHETLSAFVDGEVSGDAQTRLLDDVLTDRALARRWVSYHLIGDIMRQNANLPRVEPMSVADDGAYMKPPGAPRANLRPLGGLALAASVALVAIVGTYVWSPRDSEVPQAATVASAPAEDVTPLAGGRTPEAEKVAAASARTMTIPADRLSAAATSMRRLTGQTWSDAAPAVANRLNGYLVTHNEHLANGLRGMHPYARIVAYDGRKN